MKDHAEWCEEIQCLDCGAGADGCTCGYASYLAGVLSERNRCMMLTLARCERIRTEYGKGAEHIAAFVLLNLARAIESGAKP